MAFKNIDEIFGDKDRVSVAWTPGLSSPYFRFYGKLLHEIGVKAGDKVDIQFDAETKRFLIKRGELLKANAHASGTWIEVGGALLRQFFEHIKGETQDYKYEIKNAGPGRCIIVHL